VIHPPPVIGRPKVETAGRIGSGASALRGDQRQAEFVSRIYPLWRVARSRKPWHPEAIAGRSLTSLGRRSLARAIAAKQQIAYLQPASTVATTSVRMVFPDNPSR